MCLCCKGGGRYENDPGRSLHVLLHRQLEEQTADAVLGILNRTTQDGRQRGWQIGGDMRTILEDLYYGNITPNEQQMTPGSELKRAVDRVAKYEKQLMEQLEETEQETLTKLIRSQHEINSKRTASSNEILPLVFFTFWTHRPRSALSCSSGISIPAASTFITIGCDRWFSNKKEEFSNEQKYAHFGGTKHTRRS